MVGVGASFLRMYCAGLVKESVDIHSVMQAMGGELKQILEKQRQLEQQFELITTAEQLKEQAYSINATAQGDSPIMYLK